MWSKRIGWATVGLIAGLGTGTLVPKSFVVIRAPVPEAIAAHRAPTRSDFERAIDELGRLLTQHRARRDACERELLENRIAAGVLRARGGGADDGVLLRMAAAAQQLERQVTEIDQDIDESQGLLDRLRVTRDQIVDPGAGDSVGHELHDARTLLNLAGVGTVAPAACR